MVELANCLAEQPQWVVDRIADRHLGITFKHKSFPPSIGDVLDMVGSIQDMRERYNHYGEVKSRMSYRGEAPRKPFQPYPKLWEAFAGDADALQALDNPVDFDWLTEASKRLATRGRAAARAFILPQPVDTHVSDPLPTPQQTEKAA